jgi:bifunctional non-homologous end joining protein LigD
MAVWDRGTYEAEKFEDKEVIVVFTGDRVRGRYALIRTGGTQWLLHRMDPAEDPTRQLLPEGLSPMQPTPGPLPPDEQDWAFEVAWGGQVIVVAFDGGRPASAIDVGGDNLVGRIPELNRLGEALGTVQVVLHGEIVVLGEDGRPDRSRLDARLAARSASTVRRLARDRPALFMIADLLWLDGHSAMDLPWRGRRQLLDELSPAGDRWQTPAAHPGEGRPLLDATSAQGLPGIVAKRLDSPYQPGAVSPDWRSIAAVAAAPAPAATGEASTTAPT